MSRSDGGWRRRSALIGAALLGLAPGGMAMAQSQLAVPDYPGAEQLPQINMTDFEGTNQVAGLASIQDMIDYVETASKGRIKIQPYWGGSLMSIIETPQGVASGTADMGYTLPVYTPAEYPVTNWLNTITNQFKGGYPYGQLVAIGADIEFVATDKTLRKEYDDHNLHIIGALGATAYDLLCNKKVSNLAEAKGTATRTANQAVAKEVESMGLSSVSIVANELYEGFTRGIVKCVYLTPSGYMSLGLTDVPGQKYWIHVDLSGWMASYQVMNKEKWDSLDPLARRIITDGYIHYLQLSAASTYKATRTFGQMIKDGKIEAVQPDQAMLDALHKEQQQAIADMVKNAPPQVTDPQAVVDHYIGLLEKWRKIVSEDFKIPDTPAEASAVVDAWFTDYDFGPFQQRLQDEMAKAMAGEIASK